MTEDTTTVTEEAPVAEGEVVATEQGAAEKQSWFARGSGGQTNFDRYVTPIMFPLVAVAGIIFFVANLSRVLLSGKSTIAIIAASVVTAAILIGATALAAAPKMRSGPLAIFAALSLAVIGLAGLISVGHAQEKKEAAAVACEPIDSNLVIPTTGAIKLDPAFDAKAGCVEISYTGPAGLHTLAFNGATPGPVPSGPVLKSGDSAESKFAYTLAPGTYNVHCTVPGHEAMKAVITVK